jgi:hypothetical protein
MQQGNGHRFHAQSQKAADRPFRFLRNERNQDLALVVEPLGDLQPKPPGDQGPGQLEEDVVNVVAHLPADLQGVPETAGGEKPGRSSLAFDDQVGHQGRAVDRLGHLTGGNSVPLQHFPQDFDDCPGGIIRGGQAFSQREPAGDRLQDHHIRKRSADIDAHLVFGCHSDFLRLFLHEYLSRMRKNHNFPSLPRKRESRNP